MTIENPTYDDVKIGDSEQPYEPCNHSAAPYIDEPDTNLYTYQADTTDHYLYVSVGDKTILYHFDINNLKFVLLFYIFQCELEQYQTLYFLISRYHK